MRDIRDDVTEGYYQGLNEDLLAALPPGAGLVVEIGCGQGAMGEAYKRRHPGAYYLGLERDATAAAIARIRLDEVICGDAVDTDLGALAGRVDCIVYGDVLEHLVDPWAAVRTRAGLLKPGGVMVASIPNVQHWSLLLHLMRGHWSYRDAGLLDRTHLRFFTFESACELFLQAGLGILKVEGRVIDYDKTVEFADAVLPLIEGLGIDPERFRLQSGIYQFILTAALPA